MEIPGLGEVTKDQNLNWYVSEPVSIPLFGNMPCSVVVEGYEEDPQKEDFHETIRNLLSAPTSVLKDAEPHIFDYYRDCYKWFGCEESDYPQIESASDIWRHVQIGNEPVITRRAYGDKAVYVSIECNCDWEVEHGLQIVLRNGERVNKVGSYDGHVTNSDAFGAKKLEHVVYKRLG